MIDFLVLIAVLYSICKTIGRAAKLIRVVSRFKTLKA